MYPVLHYTFQNISNSLVGDLSPFDQSFTGTITGTVNVLSKSGNFGVDDKKVLKIKKPYDFKLPSIDINTEYIIARDASYFVYTNQYHKYVNIYKDSFQHGGISMDEIIVPLIELKNK